MINPFEIPEEAEHYLEEHSSPEGDILEAVSRHTWLNEVHPQMISGRVQGWFYRMISQMVKPSQVLEIGTFTAYSTIALAAGLQKNGSITTIEINDEYESLCRKHLQLAGIDKQTQLIIGNALEILPELPGPFDLVLIDAQKELYSDFYRLIIDKVSTGGIILADNVLWGGKVLTDPDDGAAKAVDAFNKLVCADPGVEHVLLPIRDGIMFIRKR